MNKRVIAQELLVVARTLLAKEKERPSTVFEGAFWDVKARLKELKTEFANKALEFAKQKLQEGLVEKKLTVVDVDMKLGRFKGSYFITSCKLILSGVSDPKPIESWLQGEFSPKFKFKEMVEGGALFNIR